MTKLHLRQWRQGLPSCSIYDGREIVLKSCDEGREDIEVNGVSWPTEAKQQSHSTGTWSNFRPRREAEQTVRR